MSMIKAERVTATHDLQKLVADINAAVWDDANEMCAYDAEDLAAYIARPDTIFVACYEYHDQDSLFLGMGSGRLEMKPYDQDFWVYVDEIDVRVDQRQKGAGRALMQAFFAIAEEHDCEEIWLGTEVDNKAANALYKSLSPDDVEQFVGYTWELD